MQALSGKNLGSVLRRVALALLLLVLAVAWVTLQAIRAGEQELAQSDAAFNAGDLYRSSAHAQRAASHYAPGAPHVKAAFERLRAIAVGAEATGDAKSALFAWRSMRAAAIQTRHLWLVHPGELAQANQAIARLEARLGEHANADLEKGARRVALKRLNRDEAPRGRWILVLGFGFLSCAVGLAWLAARGFDEAGRLSLKRGRWGLLLCVLGAVCWTLAIYMA